MKNIILIHALFWNTLVMKPMENRIKRKLGNSIRIHQFGYKTRKYGEGVLESLSKLIESINKEEEIVIVGHSLGGLVGRNYLKQYKPVRNIKLVTIGTPHNGSVVGKAVNNLLPRLMGTSGNAGIVKCIENWEKEYPVYCIAGTLSIGPLNVIGKKLIKQEKSDGTVLLREAILENCTKSYEVRETHTSLIYSKKVDKILYEILDETDYF
jgi:hypothetical protein